MKLEKITYFDCSRDFSHGAIIKTASGRYLGATCDPGEAEKIIREYFQTEFFPLPVHVYFGWDIRRGEKLGYTFRNEFAARMESIRAKLAAEE